MLDPGEYVARARAVLRLGWDGFLYTWSTGEVLVTALALGDLQVLDEFGESPASVRELIDAELPLLSTPDDWLDRVRSALDRDSD